MASVQISTCTSAGVSNPGAGKADNLSNPQDEARVIDISEYKPAAYALAEAFVDDHTARYFIDTPDRAHWSKEAKWDLHLSILEYITYAHCLRGLVVTAGENYGCVALWMPPGKNMDDWVTILRSGLWRLNYKLSREGKSRFFDEFFPLLHDTKLSVMAERDDDSYYLVYIGTRPSARGKGLAKKCITFVTDMADREGRASYLESSAAVNLKIYGKMGFEHKRSVYLTRAEEKVVLDIMVREPAVISVETTDEVPAEKKGKAAVVASMKVTDGGASKVHAVVTMKKDSGCFVE